MEDISAMMGTQQIEKDAQRNVKLRRGGIAVEEIITHMHIYH